MAFVESKGNLKPILNLGPDNLKFAGYYMKQRASKTGTLVDFCDDDGEVWTVNGNTDIVQKLTCVPVGCLVEITFVGYKKTKGGQDMKSFLLRYDPDAVYLANRPK